MRPGNGTTLREPCCGRRRSVARRGCSSRSRSSLPSTRRRRPWTEPERTARTSSTNMTSTNVLPATNISAEDLRIGASMAQLDAERERLARDGDHVRRQTLEVERRVQRECEAAHTVPRHFVVEVGDDRDRDLVFSPTPTNRSSNARPMSGVNRHSTPPPNRSEPRPCFSTSLPSLRAIEIVPGRSARRHRAGAPGETDIESPRRDHRSRDRRARHHHRRVRARLPSRA